MLSKIGKFFTPKRRKAVYGVVAAGTFGLLAFGVVTQEQINQAVLATGGVISTLTTLMAVINTGAARSGSDDAER
jgi:hypothetical protein